MQYICRLAPSVNGSNPPTNPPLIGIVSSTPLFILPRESDRPPSSSEIKLQITTMSEIKQPNTTNSDAVWEHILSYQRFVVQTGAVNLLVSLVKKVHGLPVHPYIPSAVASQIASEIDTKRLRAAGLGDVQILLVRKLPKVYLPVL